MTPDRAPVGVSFQHDPYEHRWLELPVENVWVLASLWVGLALVATLLAIWLRISTALSEIVLGTVAQLVIGALLIQGTRSCASIRRPCRLWLELFRKRVGVRGRKRS